MPTESSEILRTLRFYAYFQSSICLSQNTRSSSIAEPNPIKIFSQIGGANNSIGVIVKLTAIMLKPEIGIQK
jgi:hypothetical protein